MSIKDTYDIYGLVNDDKVKPFTSMYDGAKYYIAKNKITGYWERMSLDFEPSKIDDTNYDTDFFDSCVKGSHWGKID